jgi:hypothetical protein
LKTCVVHILIGVDVLQRHQDDGANPLSANVEQCCGLDHNFGFCIAYCD